jgi:outer membrane protein TolC
MNHKLKLVASAFSILALLMATGLQGQTIRKITLQEAIDLSITNSHLLKNNSAKIDEAVAAVKEANERKLPEFTISGSWLYLPITPNISLKTNSNNSGGSNPSVSQAMYSTTSISLPLFTAGKLDYGIQSAKYLEQAVRLDADENKEAVIFNSISAFSNLYKARAAVYLVKENLQQSNQRVRDFANLEKNGLLARNDLLKAELQSSNIELALLDAESNLKLASVNMALMLGLPEQTNLIPDSASLIKSTKAKSMEEYEQQALVDRKEIGSLALHKKIAELGVKSIKADYYPGVAVTGGYIAANIPGFLTITNAVNVGLGVQYNLSSLWKTKTKIAAAGARVQQVAASELILGDHIRLQVNEAYQGYLLSQKKIEVYQKAVEQATENFRIIKNKYNNSLATATDLLEADLAALQTKLMLVGASADAVVAFNKLLQTAGILTTL